MECMRSKRMPSFSSTRIEAAFAGETTAITRSRPNFRAACRSVAAVRLDARSRWPQYSGRIGISQIHVGQVVALQQPAHADGRAIVDCCATCHKPKPKRWYIAIGPDCR